MQTIQVQKQIMEIASDTSLSFPLTLSLLHFGGYFYLFKLLFSIWGYADNIQNMFLNQSSEQQVLFSQLTLEATSFFFLYWLKSSHFGSKPYYYENLIWWLNFWYLYCDERVFSKSIKNVVSWQILTKFQNYYY